MEKELDPTVIKSTQLSLGKYVKRPPLSEKLLKKPPFRFLHDIITTVLKTTGFFRNLFEEEELISDNVKDRDSKILFLNKVIYVLNSTTGKSLAAKPSKIVAGQEPEKTNELLQCLAQALDEKLSSDEAVKKYKESTKSVQISESKSKDVTKVVKRNTGDSKKLTSRSNEKLISQKNDTARTTTKQDKEKSSDIKSKKKENGSVKNDAQNAKKLQQNKTLTKKNSKESKETVKDDLQSSNKNIPPNAEKEKTHILTKLPSQESEIIVEKKEHILDSEIDDNRADTPIIEQDEEGKLNSSYTIADHLNSSSSSNDLVGNINNNTDQIKPLESDIKKEVRNETDAQNKTRNEVNHEVARSIEFEVNNQQTTHITSIVDHETDKKVINKENQNITNATKVSQPAANDTIKISRPPSVRPSSSRPGAPRMREKLENVVKDTDNLLLGKVNIIIENTQNEEEEESSLIMLEPQVDSTFSAPDQQELQLSSSEHGHLVQQILDSQKELSQISGKTEIEWQFGAQKAREAANQDIEQLRFSIQALSRVANPLGKLLDHIQEDVEVMRQELQQWTNIYEDVSKEMVKQKTLNEDSLTPFHTKLKQLERDIEEKHDKINDMKILIHKNAFRIEKLLMSGNVQ